jgi:hypothetical protein
MSGATAFQRRTAAYVIKRFWIDADPAHRFLVADEVGLGKTMIARLIIEHALKRRRGGQIDIVYLCSSQPVASQNLTRLMVKGKGGAARATRLTLLATEKRSADGVRYFALTPETSFNVTNSSGKLAERALIFFALRSSFRSSGFAAMMQQVLQSSWDEALAALHRDKPDPVIVSRFRDAVLRDVELVAAIKSMGRETEDARSPQQERAFRKRRNTLVGRLRKELACCSASALARAGIVILDEFQKFPKLLDTRRIATDFAAQLVDRLIGRDQSRRRVLLLSATPYKLPGVAHEMGERPYDDFVELMRFLGDDAMAELLATSLHDFATALRATPLEAEAVVAARDQAQALLQRVMCRTERTNFTRAGDAMVAEEIAILPAEPADLQGALAARRIAKELNTRDGVEYWKSAPFFLDFMRKYQLRTAAVAASGPSRRVVNREVRNGRLLLDLKALRRMEPVEIPSARMRHLIESALPAGIERLLWVPPSLPYVKEGGAFSLAPDAIKRLIFTEWRLAPDAISGLISYEMERRLSADLRAGRSRQKRKIDRGAAARHARFGKMGDMLRLGRRGQDPTLAMTPLALLLPAEQLGKLGDPLAHALRAGRVLTRAELHAAVLKEVQRAMRALWKRLKIGRSSVKGDDRWYWAAPLLLDQTAAADWQLHDSHLFDGGDERVGAAAAAVRAILDDPAQLGPPPRRLADVLARLAIAAPGVCARRALERSFGDAIGPSAASASAFQIARGFQSLFNLGDAAAAVQLSQSGRKLPYWRQVLEYCIDGNLQALLDEHLHLEADARALHEEKIEDKVQKAALAVQGALGLRRATIEVNGLERRRRRHASRSEQVGLRCRHALRFAEIKDTDGAVSRLDAVRGAFNSPFRPFVLASTAVGQEGLDFHPWCHAVVHWNLPGTPVELEQREGRVHRYKGHAVRLNVADAVGWAALSARVSPTHDPWAKLFEIAGERCADNPLAPCWIFEENEQPVKVRRIVPVLACSREHQAWPLLRRRLATYRLVLGLPRQEDLLHSIERNAITADQARLWKIDLAPPVPIELPKARRASGNKRPCVARAA